MNRQTRSDLSLWLTIASLAHTMMSTQQTMPTGSWLCFSTGIDSVINTLNWVGKYFLLDLHSEWWKEELIIQGSFWNSILTRSSMTVRIIWAHVCCVTMSFLILYSIQVVGYAVSMCIIYLINYVFIPCRPRLSPNISKFQAAALSLSQAHTSPVACVIPTSLCVSLLLTNLCSSFSSWSQEAITCLT